MADPVNPAGWLREIRAQLAGSACTNLQRDPDDPFDPDEDPPFTWAEPRDA